MPDLNVNHTQQSHVEFQQQNENYSQPVQPQAQPNNSTTTKAPLDRYALLGVIFGGISWLLNFWGIVGIIAVVFSILALNRHIEGTNKVIAIIGLVSGIVNILYALTVI